jgi:hypothetical protein
MVAFDSPLDQYFITDPTRLLCAKVMRASPLQHQPLLELGLLASSSPSPQPITKRSHRRACLARDTTGRGGWSGCISGKSDVISFPSKSFPLSGSGGFCVEIRVCSHLIPI